MVETNKCNLIGANHACVHKDKSYYFRLAFFYQDYSDHISDMYGPKL